MIKFSNQNLMINCIKGFFKVNEDPTRENAFIKVMPYFFENTEDGMVSRIFFSEAILMRIKNVMLN